MKEGRNAQTREYAYDVRIIACNRGEDPWVTEWVYVTQRPITHQKAERRLTKTNVDSSPCYQTYDQVGVKCLGGPLPFELWLREAVREMPRDNELPCEDVCKEL